MSRILLLTGLHPDIDMGLAAHGWCHGYGHLTELLHQQLDSVLFRFPRGVGNEVVWTGLLGCFQEIAAAHDIRVVFCDELPQGVLGTLRMAFPRAWLSFYSHGYVRWADEFRAPGVSCKQFLTEAAHYDAVFTPTEHAGRELRAGAEKEIAVHAVGFPVVYSPWASLRALPKERKIVVAHRFSQEKPLVLSAYALRPFFGQVPIAFFSPENEAYAADPYTHSVVQVLRRHGHTVEYAPDVARYRAWFASSRVCFQAPLADSFNLTFAEAAYVGACPVVPDLPPYNESGVYKKMYRPFDLAQIEDLVREALDAPDNSAWVDREALLDRHELHRVAERIVGVLKGRA